MRKAFSMLELVFVIVIIGILAATIIPSTTTNPTAEAAIELQSQIKYAQHLAMIDDKYDASDDDWYKNRWQIVITDNQYSIISDNNTIFAADPMNSNSEVRDIDLSSKYNVSVTAGGDCPLIGDILYLSFDAVGRPLVGNLDDYTSPYMDEPNERNLSDDCTITITGDGEQSVITVFPETGYVQGIL